MWALSLIKCQTFTVTYAVRKSLSSSEVLYWAVPRKRDLNCARTMMKTSDTILPCLQWIILEAAFDKPIDRKALLGDFVETRAVVHKVERKHKKARLQTTDRVKIYSINIFVLFRAIGIRHETNILYPWHKELAWLQSFQNFVQTKPFRLFRVQFSLSAAELRCELCHLYHMVVVQ